jgi:hypothetical protein
MKKKMIAFIGVVALASVAACSKNKAEGTTPVENTPVAAPAGGDAYGGAAYGAPAEPAPEAAPQQ